MQTLVQAGGGAFPQIVPSKDAAIMLRVQFSFAALCLLFIFVVSTPLPDGPIPSSAKSKAYGSLSLSFEANRGQIDRHIRFLARSGGFTFHLTPQGVDLIFPNAPSSPHKFGHAAQRAMTDRETRKRRTKLQLHFVNANPDPPIIGREMLNGRVNYFIGNDASSWHTNIPTYARVQYRDVYPGVDLTYYGNQRRLEYDITVAPGVDPSIIRYDVAGAVRLEIDLNGDLVLHTTQGEIRQYKPVIYQMIQGMRRAVQGKYVQTGPHQIGFQVAAYDTTQPLIIDPILGYSTYLGGLGMDSGNGIAVDTTGSAYVVGITAPFNATGNDIFVAKLDATGSELVYLDIIGGSTTANGTVPDNHGSGITVDSTGSAYVVGTTITTDFPTTAGAFKPTCAHPGFGSTFILKLDVTGSALDYSTYLCSGQDDEGHAIAIDPSGNAYVTGLTTFSIPTTPGAFQTTFNGGYDGFVTKLNADGSNLVYSTYLGGTGLDVGNGIAVDALGNAYVTGSTGASSTNSYDEFPTTPGSFQSTKPHTFDSNAFVAKLNVDGSALIYSTYLGGTDGFTIGFGIAVDSSGNAYITGQNKATDFPTLNPIQVADGRTGTFGDAFVTKLNATGSALVYSTLLIGSYFDYGWGIAVDSAGSAYVSGTTNSPDFLVVNALQPTLGGNNDVFVDKLSPDGSMLVYGTFLGGETNDAGYGIAVDTTGNVYVTGYATSNDFPTLSLIQPAHAGGNPHFDAFVARITEPIGTADLALTMTAPPDPIPAGSLMSYQITVTNYGPDTADRIMLNDVLPIWQSQYVHYSSATPSQGNCVEMETNYILQYSLYGKVGCDFGTLTPGSNATVTIAVTYDYFASSYQWGFINNASVSSGVEDDPDRSNNNASATAIAFYNLPPQYSNLSVNKSGSGGGTIISTPTGIDCGVTCDNAYINGTSVQLTAIPDAGSTFAGWSAGGNTNPLNVTITATTSITATFDIVNNGGGGENNGSGPGGGCGAITLTDDRHPRADNMIGELFVFSFILIVLYMRRNMARFSTQ